MTYATAKSCRAAVVGSRLVGLVVLSVLGAACLEPIDTSVQVRPELTLGEEVYLELCNRIAFAERPDDVAGRFSRSICMDGVPPPLSSGATLQTLHRHRARLITALDVTVTPEASPLLKTLLADLVPLYDDGSMKAQTDALAEVLGLIAEQEAATAALERLSARDLYVPPMVLSDVLRQVVSYPALEAVMRTSLDAIDAGGPAEAHWRTMLTALHSELANGSELMAWTQSSDFQDLRTLLLATHPNLSDGRPRFIAARDHRGAAQVSQTGDEVARPFVDADGDGWPDVDAMGRFIDGEGLPLDTSPFLTLAERSTSVDAFGRPLDANEQLVYLYRDLSDTVLGGALLEARAFLAEDASGIAEGTPLITALLGDPVEQTYTFEDGSTLTFEGFDLEQSGLLDLVHALTPLVGEAYVPSLLELVQVMLRDHQDEVGQLLDLLHKIRDWSGDFEDVELEPNHRFMDEMVELTVEMMRVDGLFDDFLQALENPEVYRLGGLLARQMRHKDIINYNPADINAPPIGRLETLVDRNQPDVLGNRSAFQRYLHLVYDTHQVPTCNKDGAVVKVLGIRVGGPYEECELFEVPDQSEFYMQAILGAAKVEYKDGMVERLNEFVADIASPFVDGEFDVTERLSGIKGFTSTPTVEAVARFMFAPRAEFLQDIISQPRAGDGGILEERHPGTIFIWELGNLHDALRPILAAFHKHDRLDLASAFMAVAHKYWPTPENNTTQSDSALLPAHAYKTGIARFEPLIARILDEGDAIRVIGRFASAVSNARLKTGLGTQVVDAISKRLFLPEMHENELTLRNGQATLMQGDGVTPIYPLAPVHMLQDAMARIQSRVDAVLNDGTPRAERLEALRERAIERFLAVELDHNGRYRLQNQRVVALLEAALPVLEAQANLRLRQGKLESWAQGLGAQLHDTLSHPLVAASLRYSTAMGENPEWVAAMEGMLPHLFSDDGAAFDGLVLTLGSVLDGLDEGEALVPLLEALAPVFDPDTGLLALSLPASAAMWRADEAGVLPQVLQNALSPVTALPAVLPPLERNPAAIAVEPPGAGMPAEALWEALTAVNRYTPGADTVLSGDDYASVLRAVSAWLTDEENGLQRLYDVIAGRHAQ